MREEFKKQSAKTWAESLRENLTPEQLKEVVAILKENNEVYSWAVLTAKMMQGSALNYLLEELQETENGRA